MESKKALASSIVQFLKSEVDSKHLGEEANEGLTVAIECLETAYGIEDATSSLDLFQMYERNASQNNKAECSSTAVPSEEDKKKAEELKTQGNNLMKLANYNEAVECYTKAIELDSGNAVYYCNRAAGYTKLENNMQAISDCEKALSLDPMYSKAHGRMGLSYLNEKNYEKAVKSYEKAVELEPDNTSYQSNLNVAREQLKLNKQQQQQRPAGAGGNPLAGLDLSSLLNNPAVMNMAQSFMQNPQMQNMFANMMGGMGGGPPPPSASVSNEATESTNPTSENMPGGFQMPAGLDFSNILGATQQFAQEMRTENPEMTDALRDQFQQGQHPPNDTMDEEKK